MNYKDECPLSGKEMDDVLKAVNTVQKHQSEINPDDPYYKTGYKDGANAAWELAAEVYLHQLIKENIFDGKGYSYIIQHYYGLEALEKVKTYYQKKIKVGDVVEHETCFGIVTFIEDKTKTAHILWEYGGFGIVKISNLTKTGKHYDIQSILDGLKEDS